MSVFATIFEGLSGDRVALREVHGAELRPTKASELAELMNRVRGSLRSESIQPGDRVGLLAPNSARWAACDLGIVAEGAVVVPLYERQEPGELAVMLADCGARLVLCARQELADGLKKAFEKREGEAPKLLTYESIFKAKPVTEAPRVPEPTDLVTIIYTSGTSGVAKGVMTDAANIDFMVPQTVAALKELYGDQAGREERVFHYLPLCFAGSRIMLWTQLFRRQCLDLSTDLNQLVAELGAARPNYFLNVPKLLERVRRGVRAKVAERGLMAKWLYEWGESSWMRRWSGERGLGIEFGLYCTRGLMAKLRAAVGPSWDFLICGSAPLSAETQAWFEMLKIPVYQVYGLTETTAILTMDKPPRGLPGTVGFALSGLEMRLAEDGELLARGPNIFKGYWGRPEATAEAVDNDGWFHTGDLGSQSKDGRWRIEGRARSVLVLESGHNVAPEPLEQAILEAAPGLEQVVVIGHGRPYLSALVYGSASDGEVERGLAAVNATQAHYRQVHRFHRLKEALSYERDLLTANEKLRRSAIAATFKTAIDEMYKR